MKPSSEARRLHPLTLVQRFVVSLPGLVFILLPVFKNTDSTAWFNLVFAAIYAAFLLPWIAVYYLRFRYWITPTELIIHSGVITRRKRNIPIDRIQNIEIEQGPLQRLLRTAKVAVYTAGSDKAEGVLEYVSVSEAREIREGIRQIQHKIKVEVAKDGGLPAHEQLGQSALDKKVDGAFSESLAVDGEVQPHIQTAEEREPLFQMAPKRVMMAGAFHFSLLYIAGMFSLLQYFDPDPTVFMAWLLRGPLDPWKEVIDASPWAAATVAGIGAVFLGWATGVAVTINKYFRFKVSIKDKKLHRSHGLLTLKEGTIPLRKVQSFIVRTNPLSRYFGFFRLELQTLGIDVKDNGFQVAAPFARKEEVEHYLSKISTMTIPPEWSSVSPVTIRRFGVRWSLGLGLVILACYWLFPSLFPAAYWSLLAIPFIWIISWARYTHMGFSIGENGLAIKTGVIGQQIWLIPFEKAQTFSCNANYFQRRLGISNVYIDTAGASSVRAAEIVDLPDEMTSRLVESSYAAFKRL